MTESPPGLYVHVPFCRSKCRYCGFFSEVQCDQEQDWLDALQLEAESQRESWSTFDTVYVGGGTPSLLADGTLEQLVGVLGESFDVADDGERTLEVNPADVTPERAGLFRALGFNRVSVGVQSFRDEELRWLGRRHDAHQAERAVSELRAAGFVHLGIDLVQALPDQSISQRLWSLDRALSCEPDHLSCYELTVERGTPLADQVAAGELELPDEDCAADGYLAVAARLAAEGWDHYEVSNFARTGETRSRHNGKYWRHVPYLGLGPAAHSFRDGERWSNLRSVAKYRRALQSGESARAHQEQLDAEQLRAERVTLGLRTSDGIDVADLGSPARTGSLLQELEAQGLLRQRGARLVPTVRGFLVADALARRLVFADPDAQP